MNKTTKLVILYTALLSFLTLNFNWYLGAGLVVGVAWRMYSGTVISWSTGIVLGILLVDLAKFITYKG